ncbi:hypothetical protein DAPPUDRAFT_246392 [Daphnia pulex]|uniref:Uncharacterized protein n=1 Tax=Daphnia pulex TaxID=6669 RepID=E9GQD8_DAPPU|nr:hypothetical protein DAPPUDRAFT_246392 [Daphnia pulex]|eukprot:EFX78359.1 hypothetical protein DAPPUDRAFT_246392 [Daphnia pulex]
MKSILHTGTGKVGFLSINEVQSAPHRLVGRHRFVNGEGGCSVHRPSTRSPITLPRKHQRTENA